MYEKYEKIETAKGYVIRCHDLLDGRTYYRGRKGVFARKKEGITMGDTYTLTGAKKALANERRGTGDTDQFQYSIERLDECCFSFGEADAESRERREKEQIRDSVENAMRRLDELWNGNDFHSGDKMRINEVRKTLRLLKEKLG